MAIQEGTKLVTIRYVVYESDGVTPKNISSATVKKLRFQMANGTVVDKVAEFVTDGQDGLIKYQDVTGELMVAGFTKVQALITMANFDGPCEVAMFNVYRNI